MDYNNLYVCVKIYYSEKQVKHFGLETLVIYEILEHIVLNIFKYIFWYLCTRIRKEKNLNYSQKSLNYITCHKHFKSQKHYSLKIDSISFFSSSGKHQSHHLLRWQTITINSSITFLKIFLILFLKFFASW